MYLRINSVFPLKYLYSTDKILTFFFNFHFICMCVLLKEAFIYILLLCNYILIVLTSELFSK